MIASPRQFNSKPANDLHAQYLDLMPRIEFHARIVFRSVKCSDQRADKVAECLALGWKWLVRLHERGKDVSRFRMVFVFLVAKAVRSGRRICGQEKARDVLSPRAQQRNGFTVASLPSSTATSHEHLYGTVNGQRHLDEFEERLADNTTTPPDQQAMFRIDFKAWLRTLTPRERRIIRAMSRNERTKDLSREFELSPGRISQMRRQFHDGWQTFCGERA